MTTHAPKRPIPKPDRALLSWLLDSDPSIRWQVLRDLTDASDDQVSAQRARVATEGLPSRWITLRALRVLDWYAARNEPRINARENDHHQK